MMAALSQVAVMAAIVATLLYVPVGLALALVLRVAGVSFDAFLTFGGAFHVFVGIVVWWWFAFAGACIYAACLFPWGDKVLGWPKSR